MVPDGIIQRSLEDNEKSQEKLKRSKELEELKPISYEELEKTIKKWLLVPDTGIIKLLPAIIIANRLPRKPIWLFLIGPSGGGKTEFLSGLCDLPDIYVISLLTQNTFLSGMPGKGDMSLLPQVDKKNLIFKDWTNMLSQNRDARAEIMGQLRDIYDGHVKKPFGNGKVAEWGPGGKIGIIAGTTPAVDMQQQMHATLGERFIHYRLTMPDRREVTRRALYNDNKKEEMEVAIRNAFYAFMKGIDTKRVPPEMPDDVKEELINLANFCTMARSGVIREFSYKKEVLFVPAAEIPTRIAQQLHTLADSFSIINGGEFKKEDMDIIYKLALDSIPQTNKMVMMEMARGNEQTTSQIATSLGYPTAPIRMYLENLALLNVCKRVKAQDSESGGNADKWTLYPEFVDILRKYEKIQIFESEKEKEAEKIIDEEEFKQATLLGLETDPN